jgi:hypothetical protein
MVLIGIYSGKSLPLVSPWRVAISSALTSLQIPHHFITHLNDNNLKDCTNLLPLSEQHTEDLHLWITCTQSNLYRESFKSFCGPVNLSILSDKWKFYQWACEQQLSEFLPLTQLTLATSSGLSLPFLIKPKVSRNGYGCRIITGSDLNELNTVPSNDYLAQEAIRSLTEYVTHCACRDGKILAHITYQTDFPSDTTNDCQLVIKTSKTPKQSEKRINPQSQYLDVFQVFIKTLGYTGFCCFDYKIIGNTVKIFEINPRLGGSLMLPNHHSDLKELFRAMYSP